MAATQRTLKKLQYDGSDVVVEVANRDGSGNVITDTYATKSELTTGLSGKQATLTEGDGIDISGSSTISIEKTSASNLGGMITGTGLSAGSDGTVSLKIAGTDQLGGIKAGTGLSIDSTTGVATVTSAAWSGVTSKPFETINSGSGNDFTVTSNKLYINDGKWATKTYVGDNFLSINTTLPATNVIPATSTAGKVLLSTSTNKTAAWSSWSTAGLLKTNSSGVVSVDTTAYITKAVNNLDNYYTKSEINSSLSGIQQFQYEVVNELPTASADTMYKIYLVSASTTAQNNIRNEYITIRSGSTGSWTYAWEQIGSTVVDLTNYVKSYWDTDISAIGKIVIISGNEEIENSGYGIGTGDILSGTDSGWASYVPNVVSVRNAVATRQPTLTTTNLTGSGISVSISGGVITLTNKVTATDVTLTY